MNRRTFVKNSSLVTAGVLAGASCANAKLSTKTIGIQLYTVRDEVAKGIDAVIAKLAQVGYKNIEMYGYNDGKYFGKDIKAMASLLKDHGLTSSSAHLGIAAFLYQGNDDVWKKAADDAAALGNRYMVIPWLDEPYRKTLDQYKTIAGRLNKGAEIAKAAGLKFAYHNHAFEFDNLGAGNGYDILLNETDANLVKMELDLYWVYNAGLNPIDMFKKQPGRFVMWHVKDMDKTDKNKQTEVGNGSIDFKAIFKEKKLSGLEQFFVEQENYDVSPYTSIEKCYAYVKKELV